MFPTTTRLTRIEKQFLDRAETGEAGALQERHKTGKNSTKIAKYRQNKGTMGDFCL
jgi:hypothetical protein